MRGTILGTEDAAEYKIEKSLSSWFLLVAMNRTLEPTSVKTREGAGGEGMLIYQDTGRPRESHSNMACSQER